jgi:hypothetical protein
VTGDRHIPTASEQLTPASGLLFGAFVGEQGVTNAAWTWVMTPTGFTETANTPAGDFYPGDDVVDWLALDPYNWYGCAPAVPTAWQSMAQAAGPFRTWPQPHGKPLMLAEWGFVEDPAGPGRRADWHRETLAMSTSRPGERPPDALDHRGWRHVDGDVRRVPQHRQRLPHGHRGDQVDP